MKKVYTKVCVNLQNLFKKLRCTLEKFTQLTKILHDRRSRRSRQISSLFGALKNTIRYGVSTALRTVYTAHTAYIAATAHTVYSVFTTLDQKGYCACKT